MKKINILKLWEYRVPSLSAYTTANRDARRIIRRILCPHIGRDLSSERLPMLLYWNFEWSYHVRPQSQYVYSKSRRERWNPLMKLLDVHAIDVNMKKGQHLTVIPLIQFAALKWLSTDNFVNLIYLLSRSWLNSTGPVEMLNKSSLFHGASRRIIAEETDRRVGLYNIEDLYTMFHVVLALNIAIDTPVLLREIAKDPRYLTARDCVSAIFQMTFHSKVQLTQESIVTTAVGTSESEQIFNTQLEKVKATLECPTNLSISKLIISYFTFLSDKYDELSPIMWSKLMIVSVCISHTTIGCVTTDTQMKAQVHASVEKICCQVRTKISRQFPSRLLVELASGLSKYRKSQLFRKAVASLVALFFEKELAESLTPDPQRLFPVIKSLHEIELLPAENPKIMRSLNAALRQLADPSEKTRKSKDYFNILGLTLADITEMMHVLGFYNTSLDPIFRAKLQEVFRLSIDTAPPMSIIQALFKLSRLPSEFFLTSTETMNILLAKSITIAPLLSPISLTLFYACLSRLSSKYFVYAAIETVNKRILHELSLSTFSSHEIAMLLESMARVESMRQKLQNVNIQAHQSIIRNVFSMFSTETSPELASRLLIFCSSRLPEYTPSMIAIILNATIILCEPRSKVQRQVYVSVSSEICRQKERFSAMQGKEIAVILSAFDNFSHAHDESLRVISTAIGKLKYISETQLSDFLSAFANLRFRSDEFLRFASAHYERIAENGFQPDNVRKAICSFAKLKYLPPRCILHFFQCHTQLFDQEDIKEITGALGEASMPSSMASGSTCFV